MKPNEASPAGVQPAAAPSGAPANATPGQSAAPAAQPPQPPSELVIKGDRGQDIHVPIERATELIKAGMRVTQAMQEANARARDADSFNRFMAARAANPVLDEAVRVAIANPGMVIQQARSAPAPIQPSTAPAGAAGEVGDGDPPPAGAAQPPQVAALESKIAELTEAVRGMLGKESAREVNQTVELELSKHPWVKGNQNASDFVRQSVGATIQAAKAQGFQAPPISQLVFEAASQVQQVIQESDQRRVQEAEERKRLRTTDPSRAASMLTPPPKLTAKSFQDGTLARAVRQRLEDIIG